MLRPESDPSGDAVVAAGSDQLGAGRRAGRDLVLREARPVERRGRPDHGAELGRRARHVDALEPDDPRCGPDVDRRKRHHVDLSRLGDRADPRAGGRTQQDGQRLPGIGLVRQVDPWAEIPSGLMPGSKRVAVLAVDHGPHSERVRRSSRHRPGARDAHHRALGASGGVLVGERVPEDVTHAASGVACEVRAAPVAWPRSGGRGLARVWAPGGEPQQRRRGF